MGTAHPQAEFIKAWADGKEVEWRFKEDGEPPHPWHLLQQNTVLNWAETLIEWRMKPSPVPYWVDNNGVYTRPPLGYKHNLHLFFEEGKLVRAEVV